MQNDGAALVAGAAMPKKVRRVRVVRPFMYEGQTVAKDEQLELPALFAAEMVTSNKAVYDDAAPSAAPAKAAKPSKGKE